MDNFSSKPPMPPPRMIERYVFIGLCALALLALATVIWQLGGWFAVGVLGLLVLFLSVRIQLEGNRPIGPLMTPDLHASQYRAEAAQHRAERAETISERLAIVSSAKLAGLAGAVLCVAGFGLFALL